MCRGYFGHPQHHNSSSFAAVEGYEFLCVKETRNGKKPGAWWSCQLDISGWWTLTVRTRATTWDSNFRNKINFPDLSRSFQIFPDLSRLSTSRFPPLSTSFVSNLLPTQLHINFSWGAPHQCEGGGNTSAEATARSAVWWMRPVILDISGCCQVEDIHYTEICKILHQSWIEIYIITWIHDSSRLSCKCTKVKPEKCKSLCFMHWHTSEITTVGSDLVSASTGWQREAPDVAWLIGCSVEA